MYDFETKHNRTACSATKWMKYEGQDIIPLWVADMDFATMPAIRAAVTHHANNSDYGYTKAPAHLAKLLIAHYRARYGWTIDESWITWLPGVVLGLNLAVKTCCEGGKGAMTFSPIYPPFLTAPKAQGVPLIDVPLLALNDAGTEFAIDFERMETQAHQTGILMLCHPHNPIGRSYSHLELERLAQFCERHDLFVCSDELHGDLILDPSASHLPFARIVTEQAPRLLTRLITLHGPGKTYNLPGLNCSWAIIADDALRARFHAAMQRLVPEPSGAAYFALAAALQQGEPWRQALLTQLRVNRDHVSQALDRMGLAHTHPQATFLTWIDARAIAAQVSNPAAWFETHGVGLSDGADFGRVNYLRLNFALPLPQLQIALTRMAKALTSLSSWTVATDSSRAQALKAAH